MATINRDFFIAQFREEANDHLQHITQKLFLLEEHPADREHLIEEIFRIAHTLKGSARMMGFSSISTLAHKMEDLFVEIRDGHLELHSAVIDLLIYCVDTINYLLEGMSKNVKRTANLEEIATLFNDVIAGKPIDVPRLHGQFPRSTQTPTVMTLPAKSETLPEREDEAEERQYVRIHTTDLDAMLNLVGEVLINQYKYEGRLGAHQKLLHEVREHRRAVAELEDILRPQNGDAANNHTAALFKQLNQSSNNLFQHVKTLLKNSRTDSQQMRLAVDNLQKQVIDVRMVPASRVFHHLPQLVRMTARRLDKRVELEVHGEETRIDSRIIEEMRDPLIHLIQNAIRHGIESMEERRKAGKSPVGRIVVSAAQEGNRIVIRVRDNGKGLHSEAIRKVAAKKDLKSPQELQSLSEQELFEFLFHPGFSTTEEVDDIAGRGFGLDIVRAHVDRVQGELEIRSQPGEGTEFIIKLPLTLTIINALLVQIAGQVFAIPTVAVEKTFDIQSNEIEYMGKVPGTLVDEHWIPLVKLCKVLGCPGAEDDDATIKSPDSCHTAIVIEAEERRIAFLVDDLVEEREIVVKHLGSCLKRIKHVAGATTVRGDVIIILYVRDLVRSADLLLEGSQLPKLTPARHTERLPERGALPTILVIDDSFNTREVERAILEEAGYAVEVAEDGKEGLKKLRQHSFELVITDIEMPNMNGLQLTRRIKTDEQLRQIPIIMVTTKGTDVDRKKGVNAGAQAYIVKGEFDDTTFLQVVDDCLYGHTK